MDFEEALRTQDETGILRSRDYFDTLVKEQIEKGINPSRIVLGGFSQGGAMSVFSALTSKEKLGGVFGLSCYLLLSDRIRNYIPENWPNQKVPYFLAHGLDDEIVPYELGDKSAKMLKELGVENVSFNSYEYVCCFLVCRSPYADICSDLGHSADPNEIEDLERFLEKTLPPEGDGQPSAGL